MNSWIDKRAADCLLEILPHAMKIAEDFKLPANFAAGHRPRHFAGALDIPESVKVVLLLAEPGSDPVECEIGRSVDSWLHDVTSDGCGTRGGHRFVYRPDRQNCFEAWPAAFLAQIFPEMSPEARMSRTVILNSFWMQAKSSGGRIPSGAERAFAPYLARFLCLFPGAVIVAAGDKAKTRVRLALGKSADVVEMGALTLPAYNRRDVREGHSRAAAEVRRTLATA